MINISNKDIWYAVGLSAIFLSGFVGTSLVYHQIIRPLRKRQHLQERMGETQRDDLLRAQIFKTQSKEKKGLIVNLMERTGWSITLEKLQKELMQAGIYKTPGNFLSLVVILASVGFILGRFGNNFLVSLLIALVAGTIPFLFLSLKKKKRTSLIERQMPDVMELLARSLRAGHTLPSAMELAGKETPDPLGTELRTAYEEQRLGLSLSDALGHVMDRVASRDLRYFVTAVLIQTETGGNLAEIMEKIGYLIRDRLRVKAKIRGLTAEGRLSAAILGILPFAMFMILFIIHKKYVMTLFVDPWGKKLLVAGLIAMTMGIVSMRRIINKIRL
jgi:tight adherence protein B